MKKLLISPSKMALGEQESQIYQNILKQATDISLNLMAVKVENHPDEFLGWCYELLDALNNRLNYELLEPQQLPCVKKLHTLLTEAISFLQLKALRITPWPVLCEYLQQQQSRVLLDEHLALCDYIDRLREQSLAELSKEDRLVVAGKHLNSHDPAVYRFDVELFAATRSNKAFHQLLADFPALFDQALAHIPLQGEVTREHYSAFVTAYQSIFIDADEKPTLAPATRLLAMRRPDVFTPASQAKLDTLCAALGIAKLSNRDFERYWQELVCTITRLPWYTMASGDNDLEQRLCANKALLPCLFFYFAEDSAQQSNYYKLLHKPKRSSSSKAPRRSKESAATLVDRALAEDDIPEHIRAKRDSIIAEVEKGRSINDTLTLMRTIFG
ncbi:hypothetical protein MHM95_17460 [Pseudoalteromonas sp. CnMc7-15]|uniref:hypothetical protein n=1 Tax=unclassified Pseudoalteromonas TaxID=194690 RepID=UPI001EF4CC9F|nr:hypothetical protein [Pseudoalteromonas sp. CnMc7-15]MCG7568063.1 hypothetical protein [Pseudoalteromonas sp. CnMc7-15]